MMDRIRIIEGIWDCTAGRVWLALTIVRFLINFTWFWPIANKIMLATFRFLFWIVPLSLGFNF